MFILAAGLNHKTAPLSIRERVSLNHGQLPENLQILAECVKQGAILSTCNRTEIYAVVNEPHLGAKAIKYFLSQVSGLPPEDLEPHLYLYSQRDAIRHIFSVASGTDSMILGESEILGQLRYAVEEAESCRSAGSELSRLLRQAISVGREVREKTGINRNRVSVSSAGVDLAKKQFGGDLSSCHILVISAGEAGKLTAKAVADCGSGQVVVTSRTYEKAQSLAQELGGQAIPFSELNQALADADIVISATAAPHYVLDHATVENAMHKREDKPLMFIDIAVPRDIDPEVRELGGVLLYDLDSLQTVVNSNLKERENELDKVNSLLDSETDKFMSWWDSLEVVPLINFMRNRAEEVRKTELEKTMAKLKTLSAADRQAIEVLTKSIVNKMLHHPTMALKESAGDPNEIEVMVRMMGLCEVNQE